MEGGTGDDGNLDGDECVPVGSRRVDTPADFINFLPYCVERPRTGQGREAIKGGRTVRFGRHGMTALDGSCQLPVDPTS